MHTKNTGLARQPVVAVSGFNGYDIKKGDFNFAVRNITVDTESSLVSLWSGTWGNTKVAGAYWTILLCRDAQKRDNWVRAK
jgi:hypothetical protein